MKRIEFVVLVAFAVGCGDELADPVGPELNNGETNNSRQTTNGSNNGSNGSTNSATNNGPTTTVGLNPTLPRCPFAVASGWSEGGEPMREIEVKPGETIYLDGSDSYAAEGDFVAVWHWEIFARPAGSTAPIGARDGATARFIPDAPGSYQLGLAVENQEGTRSCRADAIGVNARHNGLVVTLTWDTPGDPVWGDSNGTDLDLYLRYRDGEWGAAPFSCDWTNHVTEWGPAGASGNCTLELDDSNGEGPERAVVSEPEDVAYGIGVHYKTEGGFGQSIARISVSNGGSLVWQNDEFLTTEGQFWYVGDFQSTSNQMDFVDTVTPEFP